MKKSKDSKRKKLPTRSEFLLKLWKLQSPPPGSYVFVSVKEGRKWKDHALSWPPAPHRLETLLGEGKDCYFSPNIFSGTRRRAEFAVGRKLVWADLDEADPLFVRHKPSIAWRSSHGRYAGAWVVDRWTNNLSKQVSYRFGADPGGWDITQVLRVPGTRNHKYTDKPRVETLWFNRTKHKSSELGIPPGPWARLFTSPKEGARSDVLWKTYHELHRAGLNADEIFNIVAPSPWNKFKKRPQQLRSEIVKALKNKPEEIVQRFSDIEATTVEWLWKPYLPLGKVSILEGDPDLGKTWFALGLAAAISMGRALPTYADYHPRTGRTLFMSAEDDPADTLKPRLMKLNADMKQIFAPTGFSTMADDEFIRAIEESQPTLVIIDPLVAYLGGEVDMHRGNEVRSKMATLAEIASHYQCAILCIRHWAKNSKGKSIYRGLGSIDFSASARSILQAARHPDHHESRVIHQIKNNLGETGDPIGYQLYPEFKWIGRQSVSVKEVSDVDIDSSFHKEVGQCIEWLESQDTRDLETLVELAESHGFVERVVERALRWSNKNK